ncbi:MAG: GatB/YqeY domain-containing protein [Chloroflexi bacterium]|jgi:uncharacterized protein|nr:GatB/YqeY domain-containing protein [Chloroflexota bacterium]MBT3670917.1 GatB/YqeY domain-containing protein [Chloroflexota bacterium]MBT4002746.1 GatB/YqeY domain-containing protein [Chloroflexota bacterium]MBT4306369.1 GatB/YqeY domain-containing protein [Chloroflexota bacterium]MBT4532750.1 GatB/YqeY domain-containing protein [Chloroflexota bacterium]
MSIREKINEEIKIAMKSGDEMVKMVLRGTLAAIKQVEIDERKDLEEAEVLSIVQKEVKSRKESIADAKKAERPDLIEAAEKEMEILAVFLPEAMSDEELTSIIKDVISQVGATSMSDMGKVMGGVMPQVKGRADGGQINQIVKALLS